MNKISKIALAVCVVLSITSMIGTINTIKQKTSEDILIEQIAKCREVQHIILVNY